MNTSVRVKLFAIFGATLLALLTTLAVSAWLGTRQNQELDRVQGRLVPRSELGPRVEAELERLARAMQDAVAAQDPAALEAAQEHKLKLFDHLTKAGAAIDPSQAAAIRWSVQAYYETAQDVSRRMIAGESGELLSRQMTRMQEQQAKSSELLKKATGMDRNELDSSFQAVRDVNARADRFRFGISAAGVVVVALLAFWGASSLLQSLNQLTSGLARFGTGDFSRPIPLQGGDELSAVAAKANSMAESLARLSDARERHDWLKAGIAELNEHLRGELEPKAVGEQALGFLCERLGALAGAFYVRADDSWLRLLAAHAGGRPAPGEGVDEFRLGEGLIGQAGASGDLRVVDDLPDGYLKLRSGLGETSPKQLLILPLIHFEQRVGVLELALLEPATSVARELLLAVRPLVGAALEAARASAARQRLLLETQAQAERLTAQEEELRVNNQALLAQQEELRSANDELEQQRQALSAQNTELSQARSVLATKADELNRVSAYKSQFLANMSHELRTPLNSMLLLSHLLAENEQGNLTPKQVEHLRTVHSAGQDLLSLINEVLDLSKIEAGKQEVTLESVELSHFLGFAHRMFEPTATQKGVELVTSLAPDAPRRIVTDRQRIERILTNLLSNALKFTAKGHVTLEIGVPRGVALDASPAAVVALSVTDTGIGIPDAARERIFAPFEQVQGQANRGYGGTGLGLSIARESARLLGGELLLASSSSAGSCFVCALPAQARQATTPRTLTRLQVADDAAALAPGEPHLLIVEDDQVQAEQLVDIAHARGLKVVVVNSGEEALQRAEQGKVVGIILDVRLPDLDGWHVLERLKQDERTRGIPVHFVSGVDDPHRGLAMGAVGYLVKPASHAELAGMVRRLVPTSGNAQGVLVVEDDAQHGAALLAVLERGGLQGMHVLSAHAALEALATGRFGCLILDLGLPDMDGLGLLQTLRERPELGSPRVLVHTGRALSKQQTRELAAYAEAIVLKDGHSAERLLEEVRLFVRHVKGTGAPPPAPEAPRPDVTLRGVKLLLAEDDMRTVYSLSALLRSKGADVVTAETGQEALTALATHADIRGVLMDIMMPEMDGYEAMRRLRQQPQFSTLPVIALTAKAMKGERERCLEAGASDYLPKPVDGEKLLAKLQSWLSEGAA